MQKGLRVITLQGAIDKSPILLSQYWKNELLDDNIIISYFDGSNNIFVDCNRAKKGLSIKQIKDTFFGVVIIMVVFSVEFVTSNKLI